MASTVRTPPPDLGGPDDGPTLEDARRSPWQRVGRIAAVVTILAIAAMWAYLFLAPKPEPKGRLVDATFPTAAESICARAQAANAALPKAFTTPDPNDRARVIDDSAVIFDGMIRELRAANPAGAADEARIAEWIRDWESYNGDRRDFAARLRQDRNARFYVSQSDRDKRQITGAMDNFSTVNLMPSCKVPEDIGG